MITHVWDWFNLGRWSFSVLDQKFAMACEALIQDRSYLFSMSCLSPASAARGEELRGQDSSRQPLLRVGFLLDL